MTRLAAVVVNWNGGSVAEASAAALARQTLRSTLYLVDNASADGSADRIAVAVPDAIVIRNSGNRGYAAANNQALSAAREADYVLLLNNDAILPDPDGLAAAVHFLDGRPDVQGACGRYEYPSGEFQHFYNQLPTPLDAATLYGFGKHSRRLRGRREFRRFLLADYDFDRPGEIEQPAFACVLLRGSAVRAVGPMDEAFPIFFNDVDYCWRWRDRGWTWHYLPWWRVIHHHGKSTKRLDRAAPELLSSAVRFARRSYRPAAGAGVALAVAAEAAWMRWRHGDRRYRVWDITRGRPVFRPNTPTRPGLAATPAGPPPAGPDDPDVTVVIVNWNSAALTAAALRTLRDHTAGVHYRVVVVDNDSTRDDSRARLPAEFPWVEFLLGSTNEGFSRANNHALRRFASRYYLLLNPDTLQTENAVGRAVQYLDRNPRVGALGVRHVDDRTGEVQPSAFGFEPAAAPTLRLLGLGWLAGGPPPVDHACEQAVGWVAGSFLMIRRECLRDVGILDETFFLNNEDIDWCRRAAAGGWVVRYWPGASFRHLGGGTRHHMADTSFTWARSNLLYLTRHGSRPLAALYYMVVTARMALGVVAAVARRSATARLKARRLWLFATLRPVRDGC